MANSTSTKMRQAEMERRSSESFTFDWTDADGEQSVTIRPQDDLDGAFFLDHRNESEQQVFGALIEELTDDETLKKIRGMRAPVFRELTRKYSTWSGVTPPE